MNGNLLDALAGADSHPALVIPEGPSFTYVQLRSAVEDAASRLAGRACARSKPLSAMAHIATPAAARDGRPNMTI